MGSSQRQRGGWHALEQSAGSPAGRCCVCWGIVRSETALTGDACDGAADEQGPWTSAQLEPLRGWAQGME